MNQLKNILVAVDFTDGARSALQQAVRLARRNRARLHVLHVLDELDLADAASAMRQPEGVFEQLALTGAQTALKKLMRKVRTSRDTRAEVIKGNGIDLILKNLDAKSADLLVMGVNGGTGGGAGVLSTRSLRKVDGKVLLIEPTHSRQFKRIVAGIDFSETAKEVVAQARHMAERDRAELHFVHVFFAPWRRFGFSAPSLQRSLDYARDHRKQKLARLREFVGNAGSRREQFHVIDADGAGEGLVRFARKQNADLIVLGRHGRTELGYLLMGSTV
ncbi:MAG TPA: hypothetical protein DCY13_07025, partial [Verrucomicrobiales bacterium]|nr:hypothetical protein [Verrucomicrobiales bacterium]